MIIKCPVCEGQGCVSKPPWIAGDQTEWTSAQTSYPCHRCNGIGTFEDESADLKSACRRLRELAGESWEFKNAVKEMEFDDWSKKYAEIEQRLKDEGVIK